MRAQQQVVELEWRKVRAQQVVVVRARSSGRLQHLVASPHQPLVVVEGPIVWHPESALVEGPIVMATLGGWEELQ